MKYGVSFFLEDKKFYLYFLIGGSAALVSIGSRYLISLTGIFSFEIAILIGYILGMLWNFFINKFFNFRSFSRKTQLQLLTFVIIASFGLLLTTVLSLIFKLILQIYIELPVEYSELFGHITAVECVMIYSFACHKLYTFRGGIIRELKNFHIEKLKKMTIDKPEFFLFLCNNIVLL